MHQIEKWKDINGFDGRYQISNIGNVRTNDYNHTHQTKLMRISKNQRGYHQICLTKNNKKKTYKIHRLVAEAFVCNPDPLNLTYVNHIDENKDNNSAENLEWCTNAYNITYGSRTLKTSKEYKQYDPRGKLVKVWPSCKEIERELGFSRRQINRCCDGLIPSAYGFFLEKIKRKRYASKSGRRW